MNTDEYVVKFWIREGEFYKNKKESVFLNGKSKHEKAEKMILNKYKNQECQIVSVTYQ